jgi:D-inositol-3-phosphate glycosyltransferase
LVRALAVLSMHTSPFAQPGSADAGGMNVYVRELTTALARSGARCEVYARRENPSQPESRWVEPGLRVHFVAAGPPAPLDKERLVPLVGEWAAGVAQSLVALSAGGEGVELVHANYWLSAAAGHTLKHALDVPLATTFHTLARARARAGRSAPEGAERDQAERAAIECSDLLIACSGAEYDELVGLYGADPSRAEVVLPGVDHAFFSPGDQAQARRAVALPAPADRPVVLFVGRIQPLKGLTVAVSAVADLAVGGGGEGRRRPMLVVVGGPSGPRGEEEMARARALAERAGLAPSVRWVPPAPHELLSSYYRAADVCVVPSWSESFGLVALEAAACGVPVVASDVGGLAGLVDHGRTGYLVPPGDVAGFTRYLGELLDEPARARALGAAAASKSESYTWTEAARRVTRLADDLAGRELVDCS